jgi:uncharacterized protein
MPRSRRSALTSATSALAAPLVGALTAGAGARIAHAAHPSAITETVPTHNLLIVTATTGYRHDSIPAAIAAIQRLAEETASYSLTVLPEAADLTALTPEILAQQHAVLFLNTSGELPLDDLQKSALLAFVRNGGGFFGAHAATDTFYNWPEYADLIGSHVREHPWTQPVTITVEDPAHPTTQLLPQTFEIEDEIYVFRTNPRGHPNTHILLSLDPTSVGLPPSAAPDLPLAWTSTYGAGRVLYNALGHFEAVWQHPHITTHLRHTLPWLTRQEPLP